MNPGVRFVWAANRQPASVPALAARTQLSCTTRPISMPTSRLEARLDDTARKASPNLVNRSSSPISAVTTSMVTMVPISE